MQSIFFQYEKIPFLGGIHVHVKEKTDKRNQVEKISIWSRKR